MAELFGVIMLLIGVETTTPPEISPFTAFWKGTCEAGSGTWHNTTPGYCEGFIFERKRQPR